SACVARWPVGRPCSGGKRRRPPRPRRRDRGAGADVRRRTPSGGGAHAPPPDSVAGYLLIVIDAVVAMLPDVSVATAVSRCWPELRPPVSHSTVLEHVAPLQ